MIQPFGHGSLGIFGGLSGATGSMVCSKKDKISTHIDLCFMQFVVL
jgi:hypothetical protein